MNMSNIKLKLLKENDYNILIKNINTFLCKDSGQEYEFLIKLVNKNHKIRNIIELNYFPKVEFNTAINYYKNLKIEKLILWNCLELVNHKTELEYFIKEKRTFESYILTNKYDLAEKVLDRIKRKFGISLWLLENEFLVMKHKGMTKEYIESKNKFEKSYLYYIEIKNNDNEKSPYYFSRMENTLKRIKDKYVHDFMSYRLFVSRPSDLTVWENIFLFCNRFSLIDIYLLVVDFLQDFENLKSYFTDNISNKYFELMYQIEIYAHKILYDNYYNYESNYTGNNDLINKLTSSFNCEDYQGVIDLIYANKELFCENILIYEYLAISMLLTNKKPNVSNDLFDLIAYLIYIKIKNDDFSETIKAINDLETIGRIYSNFDICKKLFIFLQSDRFFYSSIAQFYVEDDIHLFNKTMNSHNNYLLPKIIRFSNTNNNDIKNNFCNWYNENISKDDKLYYYLKETFLDITINKLISKNNLSKATNELVQNFVENPVLVFGIDIQEIEKYIRKKIKKNLPLSLEETCYVFIDTQLKELRKQAFLNSLDNDIDSYDPISFIENSDAFDNVKIYFLEKICTFQMLREIYWLFDSGIEANEYRIKICNYLIDNFTNCNKKLLHSEIENITKQNILKSRIEEIDESRITIASNEIVYNNIYDEFESYIYRYNITSPLDKEIILYSYDDNFVLQDFSRNILLRDMYKLYTRGFCFADEGIDFSLSTRVRHGALKNQIIKILQENDLYPNGHNSNKYFNQLIENGSIDTIIKEKFKILSDEIQKELNFLTNNSLKVVLDKEIDGAIFNYSLFPEEEELIYEKYYYSRKLYADEITVQFQKLLITKTNRFLNYIRENILPGFLKYTIDCLDDFVITIKDLFKDEDAKKDFQRKVASCKTSLQKEIHNIEKWFYISKYNDWDNYTFSDLIEICIETSRQLFADFESVKIDYDKPNLFFKGNTLRNFVDIFLIIFNNAIVHSGLEDNLQKLKIECNIICCDNNVTFIIKNNLSDLLDLNHIDEIIDDINGRFENNKYLSVNTRQEGGMGLYKIMNILFSANKYGNSFRVVREENKFCLKIDLNRESIIYE